jgi:hypothetical protein
MLSLSSCDPKYIDERHAKAGLSLIWRSIA